MLRTRDPDPPEKLQVLKRLSKVALIMLAMAIAIGALLNLVASVDANAVDANGNFHSIWTWTLVIVTSFCGFGFMLLSVIVTIHATSLAAQDRLVNATRAMLWTWIVPFFGAAFYFGIIQKKLVTNNSD